MCKINICYNPKYNHNQMHETKIYRVIDVQDNPYHDNEPMAITSPNEELVACLQSQVTVVCWNLIPDSLDQVKSQMESNAIYYFEFQTWDLDLQPT